MMKILFITLLTGSFGAASAAVSLAAEPVKLAQAQFESFIDDYGRKIFLDPETGEILEVVGPEEQRLESRRSRRERRFQRRERRLRLWDIFGDPEDEEIAPRREEDLFVERDLEPLDRRSLGRGQPTPPPPPVERRDLPAPGSSDPLNNPQSDPQPGESEVASLPPADAQPELRPALPTMAKPKLSKSQMVALQVFLDRKGFSPGAIDGRWGSNVQKALAAWKEATEDTTDITDPGTLDRYLQESGGPAISSYVITEQDMAGPFVASVPIDYAEKAQLEALSYTTVQEALAERFHMSETYLREINRGREFAAGSEIQVAAPGQRPKKPVHWLVADKHRKQVRAYDRNGELVKAYPATIGSASTPSPSGSHSVERIAVNPEYTYNPKINFQQGENKKVLRIPPGPNGPVGSVWIALSKPTYGIHGTPEPDRIGKTNSHGCIRLTNWDARELAGLVRPGVTVEFAE